MRQCERCGGRCAPRSPTPAARPCWRPFASRAPQSRCCRVRPCDGTIPINPPARPRVFSPQPKRHGRQQDGQEAEADGGEQRYEPPRLPLDVLGVLPEGDETGQRGHQRPCAADVHAHQQTLVVVGEPAQEDGGGHVADDLTGQRRYRHDPAGQQLAEQLLYRLDPGHVAGEGEERRERHQQPPVHAQQGAAVQHQQRCHDDQQPQPVGDAPQHHGHRHAEQRGVYRGAALVRQRFLPGNGQAFTWQEQAAQQDQHRGQQERRQHDGQKLAVGDAVMVKEVQVLRIAEGRQHAAQVGGAVLQDERQRRPFRLAGALQHEPAQGQERQQRRVVGQQHRTHQRDGHQRRHRAAGGVERLHQPLCQQGEQPHVAQRAHHRQHAQQAGQRFYVVVAQIGRVRRHEYRRHRRRQHGDHRHGIGLAPWKQLHKYLAQRKFNGGNSSTFLPKMQERTEMKKHPKNITQSVSARPSLRTCMSKRET